MEEFTGKVALITGAGRGLGKQVALAFASLGATVAANDINPINLDATVSQILQKGGKAQAYVFDVAKRMPIEGLVTQVLEHFGRIDTLVNHASVNPDASLLEMDEWEFHRTLDVNIGGPFFCMQQVGRVMRQQGGGAMVNIISNYKLEYAAKGHSAYFASQSGLEALTRAAALELSAYNIRLNAVLSDHNEDDLTVSPDLLAFQKWQEAVRLTDLEEYPGLVRTVLFLCSEAASSLTGLVVSTSSFGGAS